jgi:hypothetical protein
MEFVFRKYCKGLWLYAMGLVFGRCCADLSTGVILCSGGDIDQRRKIQLT